MGDGLKKQWGVGDPAKGGSDKQAQQFQASFQKEIGVINGHLQYTSANAEEARHKPLESRRDALYPAFQAANAKIDRTNPAKAQPDIDKVLADAKALGQEVTTFRKEAEKAKNDWKARQAKYDAAVHQVEELEGWGDAQAPTLRSAVDGIRTDTNARKFAPAAKALDELLPKLKPIYDEYVKQKAAKPKYEQMLAEQSAKLDALKALEKPSQAMTTKAGEADTALQAAKAKAETKDFVGASADMATMKAANDALDKLAKDPQRTKYLADRPANDALFTEPADTTFKATEADWNEIVTLRGKCDPAAEAGNYAEANQTMAELKTKIAAYKKKIEELKKARDEYQPLATALEPEMEKVKKCGLPALEARKADLTSKHAKMLEQATAEDFKAALASVKALAPLAKTFNADAEKTRAQIKASINAKLPAIEKDMTALSGAKSKMKDQIDGLIASTKAAAAGNDDAALGKAAKDLERLPGLVTGLKQVEEIRTKMEGAGTDEEKKKAAQKMVDDIAKKGGVAKMPTEARNILIEAMMKDPASAKDTAAINKIWATPTLDPNFNELDKPIRDKIIKAYAEDPKVVQYRKDWKTMTADQKKEAIKYLTSIPCGASGWNVGDPKKFTFFDTPADAKGDILYGSYRKSTDEMSVNVNDDAHGRFDELLDTIAHEIGHKQQAVLIKDYRDGKLKAGDPNFEEAKALTLCEDYRLKHYTEFKKVYSTSPEETHSRVMGSELQNEMKKKFPPKKGGGGGGSGTGGGGAGGGGGGAAHKHKHDHDDD